MRNIILIVTVSIFFNACRMGPSTYEIFESNNNYNIGSSFIPNANKKSREIYSEDRYIYKFEHPEGCYHGFLTNRDDKPEIVQGWIIISGKEFCKEQKSY